MGACQESGLLRATASGSLSLLRACIFLFRRLMNKKTATPISTAPTMLPPIAPPIAPGLSELSPVSSGMLELEGTSGTLELLELDGKSRNSSTPGPYSGSSRFLLPSVNLSGQ